MKDKSCIRKNIVVEMLIVGMCIVHIQHVKHSNPNVSHGKKTKQFKNKNLESTKEKKRKKDSDKNFLNIDEGDKTYIVEHEEPQIVEHKWRKLNMKNEIHATNFRKEIKYLLKLNKFNIQCNQKLNI